MEKCWSCEQEFDSSEIYDAEIELKDTREVKQIKVCVECIKVAIGIVPEIIFENKNDPLS